MSSTWNNTDLQQCIGFDTKEDQWYGECKDYAVDTLHAVAGVGLFVFCLAVLALAVYVLARLCGCLRCVFCLGCRVEAKGASQCTVKRYRMCLSFIVIALLATAGVTTYIRSNLADQVSTGNTIIDGMRETMTGNLNTIVKKVNAYSYDARIPLGRVHWDVQRAQKDVKNWSDNVHDVQRRVADSLWVFDIVAWSAAAAFAVFALTAILNVHYCVPVFFFFVLVLFTAVGATVQVVMGVTSQVVTDTCDNFDAANASMTSFFDSQSYNNNEVVETLTGLSKTMGEEFSKKECSTDVATLCADWFTCGSTLSCEETLPTSAAFLREATKRAGDCVGCSIVQCATQCETGDARTLAMRVVSTQMKVSAELADIEAAAEPLYTGSLFEAAIVSMRAPACKNDSNMDDTLHHLAIALGFVAAGLLLATILSGLGSYFYKGSIVDSETRPLINKPYESYGHTQTFDPEQQQRYEADLQRSAQLCEAEQRRRQEATPAPSAPIEAVPALEGTVTGIVIDDDFEQQQPQPACINEFKGV